MALGGKDKSIIANGCGMGFGMGKTDKQLEIIDSCMTCNVSSATTIILGQNTGHTN